MRPRTIVTDIEGSFVGYLYGESTLTASSVENRFAEFSLTPGKLYRFIAIVVGADNKAAVSDPYTFKVVS